MCCDDNNPFNFKLKRNITFGSTTDQLTESIVFYFKVNDLAIDLTGYVATFSMTPINAPDGTTPTFQSSSLTSPPVSSVIIGAAEGSVSPYFNQADVVMAEGSYNFKIVLSKSGINSEQIDGIVTVEG